MVDSSGFHHKFVNKSHVEIQPSDERDLTTSTMGRKENALRQNRRQKTLDEVCAESVRLRPGQLVRNGPRSPERVCAKSRAPALVRRVDAGQKRRASAAPAEYVVN